MKKNIAISLLWILFIPIVYSQNGENTTSNDVFKTIANNLRMSMIGPQYNINKRDVEKLFFGDFNAPFEFFFNPSSECKPNIPSGFRIVRDTVHKSYILEIKHISNYREVNKETEKKYPLISGVSSSGIPDTIAEHNRAMIAKYYEERVKFYKVETHSYSINNLFAKRFYENMVSFIGNFKAKGISPLNFDGYSVTFRVVVEDEVWSLDIHMPQGDALKMANFCKQIIDDADAKKLDESKYIKLLE